jgi:hypothetical protein
MEGGHLLLIAHERSSDSKLLDDRGQFVPYGWYGHVAGMAQAIPTGKKACISTRPMGVQGVGVR